MMRTLTVLLALLLAGCAMGPNYKRPEIKTPAEFRGPAASLDQKSLADLEWWELYRDPVLENLIRTALQQNYDVRIALARVEEFCAIAGVAGFGSIPQVSAGAGATRSRVSTVGPTPLPVNPKPCWIRPREPKMGRCVGETSIGPPHAWLKRSPSSWGNVSKKCRARICDVAGR